MKNDPFSKEDLIKINAAEMRYQWLTRKIAVLREKIAELKAANTYEDAFGTHWQAEATQARNTCKECRKQLAELETKRNDLVMAVEI